MRIYAIRDRLINYYMAPFAGPDQSTDILAAVAAQVNSGSDDAIAQAPHHFEIWQLGEVDEQGNLHPKREFLADCASLVRTGLRRGTARTPGGHPPEGSENESTSRPGGDRLSPATGGKAPPNPPDGSNTAARELHPTTG